MAAAAHACRACLIDPQLVAARVLLAAALAARGVLVGARAVLHADDGKEMKLALPGCATGSFTLEPMLLARQARPADARRLLQRVSEWLDAEQQKKVQYKKKKGKRAVTVPHDVLVLSKTLFSAHFSNLVN